MIAQPMLRRLTGETGYEPARFRIESDFSYKKKTGRHEWVRVGLGKDKQGLPVAFKHHSSGAGILTSMVAADGLVELDEQIERVAPGDMVTFIPFSGLIAG